jgi:hypothetical protein
MRSSRGVAMIVALIFTGMVGLLVLQIGLVARGQVSKSQLLMDRASALVAMHDCESETLFTLLTQSWVDMNFQGQVRACPGASARLQDVNGLVPLPQPGGRTDEFVALLGEVGVSSVAINGVRAQIERAVRTDDRLPLQSLMQLHALTKEDVDLLYPLTTVHPISGFNPLTASDAVLGAMHTGATREALLQARRRGELDRDFYLRVTQATVDDLFNFSVGPSVLIHLSANVGESRVAKSVTVTLQPRDKEPVFVLETRHSVQAR